ncbi:hypothetical protein EVAR_41059_1 [Eumeta japonica]|uniref:Uncharacterized protein n=1 Tax=Eumeta variegata TaxID=151549 RepID=A0A4C1XUL7_EUMVA|nr:hypothetical protein EVAR_41059_1 [Eumeta japonica]
MIDDQHDVALGRRAAYRVAARPAGTRVGPRSTLSSKWPLRQRRGRPIRKWLGVRLSASAGSTSTSVNGLELTMCSASSSRVWRTSSRAPLSQCSGQRGFDRSHQRSQAPPMFGRREV